MVKRQNSWRKKLVQKTFVGGKKWEKDKRQKLEGKFGGKDRFVGRKFGEKTHSLRERIGVKTDLLDVKKW